MAIPNARALFWTLLIEPILRRYPRYPPDWERRRMAVFERAAGRCEACGVPAGRIGLCGQSWRVIGAHIHHVRPIASGGRHELVNLQVRCVKCHQAEHPDNPLMTRPKN